MRSNTVGKLIVFLQKNVQFVSHTVGYLINNNFGWVFGCINIFLHLNATFHFMISFKCMGCTKSYWSRMFHTIFSEGREKIAISGRAKQIQTFSCPLS